MTPLLLLLLPNPPLDLLPRQNRKRILGEDVAGAAPHRRRGNQVLKGVKHGHQVPGLHQRGRQHRHHHRGADQQQLQKGVQLADLGRLDLGRRQGEIPVAAHRLGRGQADPADVDGRQRQADVAGQDEGDEPGGEAALEGERDGGDGHERLVRHRVDDGADHGLGVVSPGQVAVDQVGEAGVEEETACDQGLGGEDEVAYRGRGEEAAEGEAVGEVPDLFVGGQAAAGFEGGEDLGADGWSFWCRCWWWRWAGKGGFVSALSFQEERIFSGGIRSMTRD